MEKFDAFISLGGRCMTAASLSKNGLRETAGPFDWNISDLEGVMNILANDFADFLDVDNIDVYDESLSFYDKKYHISFVHDVKNNFIDEYNDIRNKYKRRIDRLRKMQNGCICYIYLSDKENDIDYIMDNKEYIDNVIDTKNGNEIIFIFTRSVGEKMNQKINNCTMGGDVFPFKYYILDKFFPCFLHDAIRDILDCIPDFLDFCIKRYDANKRYKNLYFDREKELRDFDNGYTKREYEQIAIDLYYKADYRVQAAIHIANCDFKAIGTRFKGKRIDIYGAGYNGKFFYDRACKYLNIGCMIDREGNRKYPYYMNTKIIRTDSYEPVAGTIIVVIPFYDIHSIKKSIQVKKNCVEFISVLDF